MTQQDEIIDCCRNRGEQFPLTQWTMVLDAACPDGANRDAALEQLCRAYWFPLYAFARRRGYPYHEAQDMTQEYFARLIRKEILCRVTRDGGKFRAFLLTTFKCFLANEWHKARAQKRGGGTPLISIDEDAEERYASVAVCNVTPETLFQRHWAATVIERVLQRLESEYRRAGKAELFDRLRGCLPGVDADHARPEPRTGTPSERMAAYRLRRRFGDLLRREIAATVSGVEQVEEEIRELKQALA
jgi:DNA-directed RNA polymerase specialized sigma24 family protein